MRVLGSSLGSWRSLESHEGTQSKHGLTFSLAVVAAIGKPHGLEMIAEEFFEGSVHGLDGVFVSVYDARVMMGTKEHFDAWRVPMRRVNRPDGKYPVIFAGGQGLHNPMPYYDIADVIVVGDAEDPLPLILNEWSRGRDGFLRRVADISGVLVPAFHHPDETTIIQSVASDVGLSLRHDIRVNHNGLRRVEIARNCKHKCFFCGLGWRAPYRENSTDEIIDVIGQSPKVMHLQAGDAESHSGIKRIRMALMERGMSDVGWTGRLDTVSPSDEIAGNKRYAFGVEAMTHRVRRAVGKGYLTDRRLIDETVSVLSKIEGKGKGRTCWHMVAGLPGQLSSDIEHFIRVLLELDERMRGRIPRNLSIHWQPFQPLPGTPMQWEPCGHGVSRLSNQSSMVATSWLKVRSIAGRTDPMAKMCTILARSDRRGANLLELMPHNSSDASLITGATSGFIDLDEPLPWDFIKHAYSKAILMNAKNAHDRMLRE